MRAYVHLFCITSCHHEPSWATCGLRAMGWTFLIDCVNKDEIELVVSESVQVSLLTVMSVICIDMIYCFGSEGTFQILFIFN